MKRRTPAQSAEGVARCKAARLACDLKYSEAEVREAARFLGLSRYLPDPQRPLPLVR